MSYQYMPQQDQQNVGQQVQMPPTEQFYPQQAQTNQGFYQQPAVQAVPQVQLPISEQATPYIEPVAYTPPVQPEPVTIAQPTPPPSSTLPDWVKDALLIAAVVVLIGHQSSREFLSSWIPALRHIGDDRQTLFNLVIFGLLVGGGSVVAKRFIVNRKF